MAAKWLSSEERNLHSRRILPTPFAPWPSPLVQRALAPLPRVPRPRPASCSPASTPAAAPSAPAIPPRGRKPLSLREYLAHLATLPVNLSLRLLLAVFTASRLLFRLFIPPHYRDTLPLLPYLSSKLVARFLGSPKGPCVVFVPDPVSAARLWREGCFGKANLSRGGELTWVRLSNDDDGEQAAGDVHILDVRCRDRDEEEMKDEDQEESGETVGCLQAGGPETNADSHWRTGDVARSQGLTQTASAEHMQLSPYEVIFLKWAVGCLSVVGPDGRSLSTENLWATFCRSAAGTSSYGSDVEDCTTHVATDLANPFAVRYAVYHHYRSLGYVVRSGLKYGADFVLYRKGPMFHHSDYAVVVIPVAHPESGKGRSGGDHDARSGAWDAVLCSRDQTWLMGIVRVCGQVRKTLIIAYVTISPQWAGREQRTGRERGAQQWSFSPGPFLSGCAIREVMVTRWQPTRERS